LERLSLPKRTYECLFAELFSFQKFFKGLFTGGNSMRDDPWGSCIIHASVQQTLTQPDKMWSQRVYTDSRAMTISYILDYFNTYVTIDF